MAQQVTETGDLPITALSLISELSWSGATDLNITTKVYEEVTTVINMITA